MGGEHPRVSGVVEVPGDKSISHRALILACLSDGESRIRGILESDDVESTARCLRALGCDVPPLSPAMKLRGKEVTAAARAATFAVLDCGNSGTTARLLAGLAAARPVQSDFVGDASLSQRPMGRVADPLRSMGASIEWLDAPERLPMRVGRGAAGLSDIDYVLPVASAQVKSALLLAGLCGGVAVRITEPAPSRDHTERLLRASGVPLTTSAGAIVLPADARGTVLAPLDLRVPGDPSSAAFLVVLALLAGDGQLTLRNVLLNPTRAGFLRVLERMGAKVEVSAVHEEGGESVGDLVVGPARLRGTEVGGQEVVTLIDEIPVLAAAATRAAGDTVFRGAGELRVKESDRLSSMVENLRAIGVHAEELGDGFRVSGTDGPLSGRVVTRADHRVAMAFGILGATAGCDITIDDPACVSVSYPSFWTDLARVVR